MNSDRPLPNYLLILAMPKLPVRADSALVDKPNIFAIVPAGWPIDLGMKLRKGERTMPPEGHPRRCQGVSRSYLITKNQPSWDKRKVQIQCVRWARKGHIYCNRHGGREEVVKLDRETRVQIKNKVDAHVANVVAVAIAEGTPIPEREQLKIGWRESARLKQETRKLGLYKGLGPRLQAMLDEAAEAAPHEKVSLLDDLDIARIHVKDCLNLYDKHVLDPEKPPTMEVQMTLSNMLAKATQIVAEIAAKAAKVHVIQTQTVDHEQITFIINRVNAILERHLAETEPGIVEAIRVDMANIRLPPRRVQPLKETKLEEAAALREAVREMRDKTIDVNSPAQLPAHNSDSNDEQ